MEPKFKTSFIPKKPVTSVSGPTSTGKSISFIMLLATVIFLASVLFAAGVFLYKKTIEQQIQAQREQLEIVRQSFDPPFIERANRLNRRIIAANRILDRHLSPSRIFELLEQSTLQTISFTSLKFNNNVEGKIVIEGAGEGREFSSIVLQSDEFGRTGSMRDVLFSGLEPQNGVVNFNFEATLDPQLILYAKNIQPVNINITNEEVVDDIQEDVGIFGNQ
jgi:hypothetical protein